MFAAVPAEYALAGAVLFAGTLAVYRLPVLSLSALAIVGIGPLVFVVTGRLQFNTNVLSGKALTDLADSFALLRPSTFAVSTITRRL